MKYKSVIVTQRGVSPEVLKIKENELRPPAGREARVKVYATPVCRDDVAKRVGNRPFLPKIPFVPGYSILGVVDSVGEGVSEVAVGDRVAALTTYGGYAEYIYVDEEQLVHVPSSLDAAEAVTLILNYMVAYQALHRSVKVKPGDKALIIGASGGVGTAFLQLGGLAGLVMYGTASSHKHGVLTEHGATPIDYRTQDFVEVVREAEPGGVDYVFNGMGREYLGRGLAVLRRGGVLVQYGAPQSMSSLLSLLVDFALNKMLPRGKSLKLYGTHRVDIETCKEDWVALFKLLEAGRIKPVISAAFPLMEAAEANRLLESGRVAGNIVLLAPELLKPES
jgi:NADPH:quinone reductase-like Zn-dependent oxidoreductase